jgi:hypothetical protein
MRKLRWFTLCIGLGALVLPAIALGKDFTSKLSGDEEVPARDTGAHGNAIYKVNDDATELTFRLVVTKIDNAFMAHIHLGPAGSNGPIVAFLFGPVPQGGGTFNGMLSEGTITAANLIGPLAGQPLSALIDAMNAGNTYTNVHTNDGVNPPNTGPGDFPGGEIRGQIMPKD